MKIQIHFKKVAVLFCGILLCLITSFAQQDEQSSLYMFNALNFNPAYAGSRGRMNVTAIGRFQWVGISGAPRTQFLSIHAPIAKQNIGLGANIVNDIIGARSRTSAYVDFAYAIKLNREDHRLAFGVNAGIDIWQMNTSDMYINDPSDVAAIGFSKAVGNLGAGIYYYGKKHYVGFSVPRILENELNNPDFIGNARSARHFYIMGGYVFGISSITKFKPSTIIKITPNAPLTFDLNASFLFKEKFWLGTMWRFNESVGVNLSYIFANVFTIGYAFEFAYNDLRFNQYGSHEVMLQFDINKKRIKYNTSKCHNFF